jgi:hypothetical protein
MLPLLRERHPARKGSNMEANTCDYSGCSNPILYRCSVCGGAFCARHSRPDSTSKSGEHICDNCYAKRVALYNSMAEQFTKTNKIVDDLKNGFLQNRNYPQIITLTVPGESQLVVTKCLAWLKAYGARITKQEQVNGLSIIEAQKGSAFGIGYDHVPHVFLILIRQYSPLQCEVSVGCRYTEFKIGPATRVFSKAAKERVENILATLTT